MATKAKKTRLYLRFDERCKVWRIVEDSQYGLDVLASYDTLETAQAAIKSLRGSAVPRLSLLFPFGR